MAWAGSLGDTQRRLINAAVEHAREVGCYKVILDCAEDNVDFYAKCGLSRKEVQMVSGQSMQQYAPLAASAVNLGCQKLRASCNGDCRCSTFNYAAHIGSFPHHACQSPQHSTLLVTA